MVELKIADLLQEEPKHISFLANNSEVDEGKLYHIIRFLFAQGLFNEVGDKSFFTQ